MKTDLKLEGKWWKASKPEDVLFGYLFFNKISGGKLYLEGSYSELETTEEERFTPRIILGILSDGSKITLVDCIITHISGGSKTEISIPVVLEGYHFQKVDQIIFENISIKFSNLNKWFHKTKLWKLISQNRSKIVEISAGEVKDYCRITIMANRDKMPNPNEMEEYINDNLYFKIESFREKTIDSYQDLRSWVQDFLNFTIVDEVEEQSMEGEVGKTSNNGLSQVVKIFYRSPPPGMVKPTVRNYPIFTYECISSKLNDYLKGWLEIKMEYGPIYDMYFSVMYNPELYLEFRVMAFVTALEIYHDWYLQKSVDSNELSDEAIDQQDNSGGKNQDAKGNKTTVKGNKRNNKSRLELVFDFYSDITSIYFKSNKKKAFAELAIDTRNYFTHFRKSLKEKAARDKELFYLTQDLQLLVQFSMLTLLGFTIEDMKNMFNVNRLQHLKFPPR
jgi:ApeA N-terminal domain 1/Apea-like HEPN